MTYKEMVTFFKNRVAELEIDLNNCILKLSSGDCHGIRVTLEKNKTILKQAGVLV